MTRYLLIALLIFAVGCDNFRWPDPRRGRGDRRRGGSFGLAASTTDPSNFGSRSLGSSSRAPSPNTRPASEISIRMATRHASLVEAGHLLQEFASPRDVVDSARERHLCQNILFMQAITFAETNHFDEAFHALQVAERFGFADVERLKNSPALTTCKPTIA